MYHIVSFVHNLCIKSYIKAIIVLNKKTFLVCAEGTIHVKWWYPILVIELVFRNGGKTFNANH